MSKTFRNVNQVKKHFFPNSYKKEMEEVAIKQLGIGKWLAKDILSKIKEVLR